MTSCLVGRRSRRAFEAIVVGMLVAGTAPALPGQASVEVGPSVGYYRPLGHFAHGDYFDTRLPSTPQDLSALAYGGTAVIRFTRRLGLEVDGTVVPDARSSRVFTNPGGFGGNRVFAATITIASAEMLLELKSSNGRRLWVGAGPGFIHHGGDSYDGYGTPSEVAGVAAVGGDIALAKHVHASASLSALVYRLRLSDPRVIGSGVQEDGLVRLGLVLKP
ncbi:MAG: hypothetical protein ABI442_15645 [Gemmatimonadaceae bacterium]